MTEKQFKEEFLEEMNEIKKEKPERVTVDDIIGLVDCEPTDSVEEVRKLRGREDNNFYWYKMYKELLNKNKQLKLQYKELEISLLNNQLAYYELADENEQLRKELEDWKSNCLSTINENSILWNEIAIMRKQGAKPSSAFEEYCSKFKGDVMTDNDCGYYEAKCSSLEDGYLKLQRENYKLKKENEKLKGELRNLRRLANEVYMEGSE